MQQDIIQLTDTIVEVHQHFSGLAARQVNTAFTLRNWLIGFYLVEYEQQGADRAQYGERVLRELAFRLRRKAGQRDVGHQSQTLPAVLPDLPPDWSGSA